MKEVEIKIGQQGRVIIGSASLHAFSAAFLFKESDDIHLIELDLHSKYANIDAIIGGDGEPGISLSADGNTLHVDQSRAPGLSTVVYFPQYKGWSIYSASAARYSVSICMVRD